MGLPAARTLLFILEYDGGARRRNLAPRSSFHFGSGARLLRLAGFCRTVKSEGLLQQILQSALVDLVAFENVYGAPLVAFEHRVEQFFRILEGSAVGKREFDLILVGICNADHTVLRPRRSAHPLPLLDNAWVGGEYEFAQTGEDLAAPIVKVRDLLVNALGRVHVILNLLYLSVALQQLRNSWVEGLTATDGVQ